MNNSGLCKVLRKVSASSVEVELQNCIEKRCEADDEISVEEEAKQIDSKQLSCLKGRYQTVIE